VQPPRCVRNVYPHQRRVPGRWLMIDS
jgi:hypothetical protein